MKDKKKKSFFGVILGLIPSQAKELVGISSAASQPRNDALSLRQAQ